jgi:hypothetical protein
MLKIKKENNNYIKHYKKNTSYKCVTVKKVKIRNDKRYTKLYRYNAVRKYTEIILEEYRIQIERIELK